MIESSTPREFWRLAEMTNSLRVPSEPFHKDFTTESELYEAARAAKSDAVRVSRSTARTGATRVIAIVVQHWKNGCWSPDEYFWRE